MQLEVERTPDGTCLKLSGELDTAAAQDLDAQLEALVPELQGHVMLDLGGVTCLTSQGLRIFLRLDKLLKAQGNAFVLKGGIPSVLRIFRYCGLDTYFRFIDTHGVPREPAPLKVD